MATTRHKKSHGKRRKQSGKPPATNGQTVDRNVSRIPVWAIDILRPLVVADDRTNSDATIIRWGFIKAAELQRDGKLADGNH